jgi:hypothetical protein
LLELKINGKIAGEEIKLPEAGGSIAIQVSAQSIAPFSKVVIYRNGAVWKELPLGANKKSAQLRVSAPVTGSGGYSLYAEGPPATGILDASYPQASSNAIRVYVGGQKIRSRGMALLAVAKGEGSRVRTVPAGPRRVSRFRTGVR